MESNVRNVDTYVCKVPGHSRMLQRSILVEGPKQSNPPIFDLIFRDLVLLGYPPPHDALHSPIIHSPHSQLT